MIRIKQFRCRYLYGIIPVKIKKKYLTYVEIIGFWGFILNKIFHIKMENSIYIYYGSYIKGVISSLKFRIKKNR